MPSLFDIGKSGLQAYRQSLAVTGQNIANVNTKGYKKRDASLAEVSGAGGGVTEISDQTGLGVRVEQIRRSFDEFLLDKSRQASALFQKSDTFLQEVRDLENLLLPGDSNLSSSISNFFNALQEVAAAPDDQAPRIVANEQGKDMAGQFNLYSDRIDNLKGRLKSQANNAVTSVNLLLTQLSSINEDLLTSGLTSQTSNAKLDQRDLLIDQLSEISQITVNYGSRGDALIRLGNTGSGPIILEKDKISKIDVLEQGERLQPVVGLGKVATNQIQGGIISGLADAYALVGDTQNEIDNLAIIVAKNFNQINKNGLNLEGNIGKKMFSVTSLEAIANPTNRTTVGAEIIVDDPEILKRDNYSLQYSSSNNSWTLNSSSLDSPIVSNTSQIEGPGFKVSIFGSAMDGDEFNLKPVNESKGIQYLFTRPQDIAAAAKILISSDTQNLGSAQLQEIPLIASVDDTTLENIESVFSNSLHPVTSTQFSSDGGVAIIQEGTSSVNLSSYKAQPTAKFGLSSSDISSLTNMTLTLSDSSTVSVDLTGLSSIQEVAQTLNNGLDVNGSSHNFRTKGLFASGGDSSLTIASNNLTFNSATLSTGTTLNGVINNPTVTAASDIQIFTREGRHLSGTTLSTSEIAKYLTKENGFNISAEYRADYLNGTGSEQYRGIEIERSTTAGNHTVSLMANGSNSFSAQQHASTLPASNVTSAYTLKVTSGSSSSSVNISVPVESSAGYVAGLINTQANNLGVEATALTRVKIPAPSSNGTISFSLKSKAGTNSTVSISASVLSDDLTNLATAINNFSGRTGVTAYLSNDKNHVIMENTEGDDIELTSFTAPANLTLSLLKSDFSSAATLTNMGSTNKAARFGGELQIESSGTITTSNDGGSTNISSSANAFKDGFFKISSSTTGETKTIKPVTLEGDISGSHPSGIDASSSVLSYGLTLPQTGTGTQFTTSFDASKLESVSANSVAKSLADGLRSSSPSVEIRGNSISSLPADDSSFQINHDGLTYTITMKNGEARISGGETDMVDAYFEDPNEITINTTGFNSTSTITSTEHGLETGDAIIYNAAEKVKVDTTNFTSTVSITAESHGFTTGDPIVYKAGGNLPINGLTDGTTYFAIRVDADTFKLATTSSNASGGTAITITGGSGGSVEDTFASPITGLTDGETYFVVKTDDHNFKLAQTLALATNASPSTITIAGQTGGNALDTFDPGKRLYLSAGKTISASQFSFATDSVNDTNATAFGMLDSNIETTITGSSITTPAASDSTHFHLQLNEYANPIGVFVRANSKTINTSTVGGSSTTLTSAGHGFKTGDKILYTAAGTAMSGLSGGTSYFAKVVDANTFSLASTFENATADTPTLLSFGGGNGHASDTFATVYAQAYISDNLSAPATTIGISAEINQVSDTNAQISIIKEADKNSLIVDTITASDGTAAENFGFKTNLTRVNVLNDEIKITSISTDQTNSKAISVSANNMSSLVGNNLTINNLPPEDLIILSTGSGANKIAASYGEKIPVIDNSEFRFVIDSTNSSQVEIFEADTLHSIATRLIPTDGKFSAIDRSFEITGETKVKDIFHIQNNNEGVGDNRNILQMIALQESDVNGLNSGSFQDIFNTTLTEIGSTVRSAEMNASNNEASRDEAKALEDERSGVEMDEEAAALIQFQQSYSANARIIQTARELFDSLIQVIRS